jgi:hypothetical protein
MPAGRAGDASSTPPDEATAGRLFDPRLTEELDRPRLFGADETAQLFAIADAGTSTDREAMRALARGRLTDGT